MLSRQSPPRFEASLRGDASAKSPTTKWTHSWPMRSRPPQRSYSITTGRRPRSFRVGIGGVPTSRLNVNRSINQSISQSTNLSVSQSITSRLLCCRKLLFFYGGREPNPKEQFRANERFQAMSTRILKSLEGSSSDQVCGSFLFWVVGSLEFPARSSN